MNDYTDIWLSRTTPTQNNQHDYRLICFPHAGGTASFFRSWGSKLADFEVCAVRYPGRTERIDESQPTDLLHLAKDIAKAVEPLTDLPLVLFGHSMGAAVALETARALEKKGVLIIHLFASGSRNGPCPPREQYAEEGDESLCKNLIEMGGTNPEAAKDPIFFELVLPAIRADGKMFHEYEMDFEPYLNCPVTTIYGDVDNHADVRPWQKITSAQISEQCVTGNHFYLISEPPFDIIKKGIETYSDSKMSVSLL